ncbi:4'-phosphopantetheinyl transferase superfamily protein [Streptomyces albiaxialis]|uniref:4'-phosphopantetheinyl transferase superfamily protein n=1 Tax=Streptomyces albiaxialis TaxID=329523 RepID=A0ABN2WN66_9ACTN
MITSLRVLRVSAHVAEARTPSAYATLSRDECDRAEAFLRDADRDRYLVAHTALRRELGTHLGVPPGEVPLTRADCPVCDGPHGRPSVAGDPVHFSLSHAGDLVLIALADETVGVDVEEHPGAKTVAETTSALHPRERAELEALPEAARPAAFARCWTRKEAYLKGTGTGLAEDPALTYVSTLGAPADPPGWRLADVEVPEGYAAASALATDRPPERPLTR